jgi:hypothetical protein
LSGTANVTLVGSAGSLVFILPSWLMSVLRPGDVKDRPIWLKRSVAPLMAHIRDSARTYGKSDPIDARVHVCRLAMAAAARLAPRTSSFTAMN